MSKRRADTYLIKGEERIWPDDDLESDRDKIDPVQIASEEVMATRKIAKPRRNRFGKPDAAADQNNGISGFTSIPQTGTSGTELFGSMKVPTSSSTTLPPFSFGSSTSNTSGTFAMSATSTTTPPTSFGMSGSTESKTSNPFASIKSSTAPKSLFPPNSPFSKFPPAPTPSAFTSETASQKPAPVQPLPSRGVGPIRTPRHSIRDPAPQTPQPKPQPFTSLGTTITPQQPPAKPMETPGQGALVRSNGDKVLIVTPDRNPSERPEKHYWQRIKAMNEAFHEAVGRSIEGDAFCNLEWLFGQYKYWREEIEKGYPYDPSIDSPANQKQSSRVEDLKSGITLKPPTPSRSTIGEGSHRTISDDTMFARSQAPPPESQKPELGTWEGGSTQSTERSQSLLELQSETPRAAGSKTAETILGVLDSPMETEMTDVASEYKATMEAVKKQQERDTKPRMEFSFPSSGSLESSFGKTVSKQFDAKPKPVTFSSKSDVFTTTADKPESSTSVGAKSLFSSTPLRPFAFGSESTFPTSKPSSTLGQGSTFPTISAAKPFSQRAFSPSPSFPTLKSEVKPSPSPKPSQPPVTAPKNRFAALSVPSPEKEVITIDSDDEMVDEQEDEEMVDEEEEEGEGEEEDDEVMDDEEAEDDVEDKDYINVDDEEEEEEEPVNNEDVAKEAEELVEASPKKPAGLPKPPAFSFEQATGAPIQPFTFGVPSKAADSQPPSSEAPKSMSSSEPQIPKIPQFGLGKKADEQKPKESETPETRPAVPPTSKPLRPILPKPAPELLTPSSDANTPFRFGLPTTSSTFKPQVPELAATPARTLRKEFKFGLPSNLAESKNEPAPLKGPEAEEKSIPTIPAKRPAEGEILTNPPSLKKPGPVKQTLVPESTETAFSMGDTIEVQNPPKSAATDTKPLDSNKTEPVSTGDTASDAAKDAAETPMTLTFGTPDVRKNFTWTPDKPIKFDTPPSTFAFGQTTSSQSFKFGGLSTPPVPIAPKPSGSFGSTSAFGAFGGTSAPLTTPNLGFSFGQQAKPASKDDTREQESQVEPEGGEDEVPVVSEDVGTAGEEDEETVFSERAKLIHRLSAAERQKEISKHGGNAEDVKIDRDYGVGVVRVNVHKETSKARILFRLEGSGRVVLNSYLVEELDYVKQGKSMVLVPATRGDGTGFDTYFVRLKESVIAENLAKTLQEKKSI